VLVTYSLLIQSHLFIESLLALEQHALKSSCVTRWGSTYEMLAQFTEQQQAVCAVLLEDGGDRVLMPSSTEFAVIEELVKILKPFDDATDILSGEAYPTLGIIQPVFHQFLNDVLVTKPGDKDVVKKKSKMQSEKTCLQGIKIKVLKQCYL